MIIDHFFLDHSVNSNFHQEISPIQVHQVKHECHIHQILVFESDYVPFVSDERSIHINVRQQAEREYKNSAKYPNDQQG